MGLTEAHDALLYLGFQRILPSFRMGSVLLGAVLNFRDRFQSTLERTMHLSLRNALFFLRTKRLGEQLENLLQLRAFLLNFLLLFIFSGQKMGG